MDGVLRQRPAGRKQSAVGTVGKESGKATLHSKRDGRNGDKADTDRVVEVLDERGASTPRNGAIRGGGAQLSFREQIYVFLCQAISGTRDCVYRLLTGRLWDEFFHSRTDEVGCKMAGLIRIAYSICAFGNIILMGLDFKDFFLPSTTLITLEAGRQSIDQDTRTIFEILPQTDTVYWAAYWLLFTHTVLLGLGIAPRFQAVFVFFWTCMFRHHNNILYDDEDTVFKQLAFFLIFFPLDQYTIWSLLYPNSKRTESWPMWPFRLMQIQMCLIMMSTGLIKWKGNEWLDGSALFYVIHLDDLYGNLFNPHWMFGYYSVLKFLTWSTLVFEVAFPVLVWFDKTRLFALLNIFSFHLGLSMSMNLNLFHWIMSVGWLSFYVQPEKVKDDDDDDKARSAALSKKQS
jgi:hypothetical protein